MHYWSLLFRVRSGSCYNASLQLQQLQICGCCNHRFVVAATFYWYTHLYLLFTVYYSRSTTFHCVLTINYVSLCTHDQLFFTVYSRSTIFHCVLTINYFSLCTHVQQRFTVYSRSTIFHCVYTACMYWYWYCSVSQVLYCILQDSFKIQIGVRTYCAHILFQILYTQLKTVPHATSCHF